MADAPRLAAPIGWPLLPLPDESGRLSYPTLEQSVRQSIQIILRTRPGEQLMRARFGAGLQAFLNEPNNLTTRRRIHDAIAAALEQWEPRILLDRVDVLEVPDQPARLRVEIAYRIRRTGVAQRLALSMDVES
jgi:phage baseplate assembly protein W